MADSEVDELNALFASSLTSGLESDVLAELQSIMRLHSIPPQELFYKWESYSMKMGADGARLDIINARALKQDIQESLEKENRNKAHLRSTEKRVGGTPRNIINSGDVFGMLDGLVPNTPRAGLLNKANGSSKRKIGQYDTPSISKVKGEPASSHPDYKNGGNSAGHQDDQSGRLVSFNERSNAGQTVEVLNDHLSIAEPPIAPYSESRIKLTANSDMKKLSYKPMAMKSSEASEILDDRIDEFMLLVQDYHKLDESACGSAASQSISEIVAIGRIASDSSDGKLNKASLVLETSRRIGAGLRTPLDISNIPGFQFFPGQIVALRGINVSGDSFKVKEILDLPYLSNAASTPSALEGHIQRLRGGPDAMEDDGLPAPLNMLVASGPYTTDDNLDFEPLHAICSQAADTYADAVILTGPFLDINHPLIASGDFDLPDEALVEPDTATMITVFKYLVAPAFQQLHASNPNVTILLIPSVRDAISNHIAWPQEPFPRKELGLPKSVRIVGNPMTISINEIVTGISSQDILYELRHEEVVGGKVKDPTLLARLSRYLIEQRHFFPLVPPVDRQKLPKTGTAEGIPTGAMLDLSYLKLGEMLNVRPDMLIAPSALPPFAKVVESVLVINPGYMSKRRAAGTYAKLSVHPRILTDEEKTAGKMLAHKLFDRARVDIIKI